MQRLWKSSISHAVKVAAWAILCGMGFAGNVSAQLTPENPRVRDAIERGIQFLDAQNEGRPGGKALLGLTYAKYGAPKDHPKITGAVSAIKAQVKNGPEKVRMDIYSTGIAIMCLVALDPSKYRYEIETLVQSLHHRQKEHGAWGYPVTNERHGGTCDTSMTQYAVLGLWEAEDQAGVDTPALVWDRVARWLVLTQDPSGGFGYQGLPASRLGAQVKQGGVRHSMTAAANGSLYIVKDRVGIRKLKKDGADETPEAFVPFETELERQARIKTTVDLRQFARAMASGNRWIDDKYDVDNLKTWIYYSLYAIERYESLKEAQEAGQIDPLPKTSKSKWYNKGARFMLRNQKEDGSWESNGGPVPDTCFSVLFLLGSTRKTLQKSSVVTYTAGRLIGGRGIPATSKVRLRDGRLVVAPLAAPIDQVLAILENAEHPSYAAAVEALADLSRTATPAQLRDHARHLSRLVLNSNGEAQALAIDAVARSRDLNQVPLLVHVLKTSDGQAMLAAHRALQVLSRQFDAASLKADASADQRGKAADAWTNWYLEIRPDADMNAFDVSEEQ